MSINFVAQSAYQRLGGHFDAASTGQWPKYNLFSFLNIVYQQYAITRQIN